MSEHPSLRWLRYAPAGTVAVERWAVLHDRDGEIVAERFKSITRAAWLALKHRGRVVALLRKVDLVERAIIDHGLCRGIELKLKDGTPLGETREEGPWLHSYGDGAGWVPYEGPWPAGMRGLN